MDRPAGVSQSRVVDRPSVVVASIRSSELYATPATTPVGPTSAGFPVAGGLGGCVTATIGVSPGETLAVFVGGMGGASFTGLPGFNGGGAGGGSGGGNGGGGSDVRQGGSALADRVVVGGGGGGSGDAVPFAGAGGAGGGLTGGPGGGGVRGGGGGTQSAGGAGGSAGALPGLSGVLGAGGSGGFDGGGGGGGGYYGGGGGDGSDQFQGAGGGGGGSSFPADAVHEQGVRSGNGIVTITDTAPASAPGACDYLLIQCGGPAPGQPETPPLAPPMGGDSGPAVGHARMPNLRATVSGHWQDGTIRVTLRVLISKPRLVDRWFLARVRIPALEQTKLVRISAHHEHVRTLHLSFTGSASVIGKRVIARIDPTDRILETRRSDNTASAPIT